MDAETIVERVSSLYNKSENNSETRPDASQEVVEMKHTANRQNQRYTALYCRLSRDDGTQDDSSSIQTQKTILSKYAVDYGYRNTRFFVDAGKSGRSIEGRPQFSRMLEDIKSGKDNVSYVMVFKILIFRAKGVAR